MIEPLQGRRTAVRATAQIHGRHRTPTQEALWNVITDAFGKVQGTQVGGSSASGQERTKLWLVREDVAEVLRDRCEQLCHQPLTRRGVRGFVVRCNRA